VGRVPILTAIVMLAVSSAAHAQLYCTTVIGEVEGFGQDYTRFTAERSRDEAIAAEKARRREMGREVEKVDVAETECEAVYPLGFEEWYCVAKADVCVAR
jgi:hypothetical protein